MAVKEITIANFNCTFRVEETVYPMIHYFNQILFPALTNYEFVRLYKDNEYYLTDISLVNLSENTNNPEIALIGRHVRRHKVNIKQDYSKEKGFIPIGEIRPSAPYSSFILLIRNHRLIHFKDQSESPEVRSLSSTVRVFIDQYRKKLIQSKVEEINKEQVSISSKKELRKYLNTIFPQPEIDIVPIPSEDIVEQKMKDVIKISTLKFRVYSLNSEIDPSDFYSDIRQIVDELGSPSAEATFSGPRNIDRVTDYLKESKGMADFTVKAHTGSELITLKPDQFVEVIQATISEETPFESQAKQAYLAIKHRSEIINTSQENIDNYKKFLQNMSM